MIGKVGIWAWEIVIFCSLLKLWNYEVLVSELQKASKIHKVHLSLFLTELMKKMFHSTVTEEIK